MGLTIGQMTIYDYSFLRCAADDRCAWTIGEIVRLSMPIEMEEG